MKNIIVGLITLLTVLLMGYLVSSGTTFQGGEHGKIIEDITVENKIIKPRTLVVTQKKGDNEKLQALQDKAGNANAMGVSLEYKKRCASCHGVNGKGIIGPDISGKSAEFIYAKLLDYKAGRLENPVMKGLVMNLSKKTLKTLSIEIGNFKQVH
ncbi:MAG: c-type cytochrome [Sulfurimonas sp.]|nr:c-type cytochrome [Sulfurimonas sp.]